jgi:integrase
LKPQWSDRPISSLRKSDVAALVNTVSGISPEMANRVKALISKLWECGQHLNYIDNALKNPAIDLPDIEILDVASTTDDSERVLAAIETEPDFFVRAAMLVLLVSSLHKSEVIEARWEQIDWTTKTISVERQSGAKQKRLFTLPLSGPAYAILESLPKHPDNPHIFCGRQRGMPIDDFDERWERIRALAQIKQTKLQGFRSAVASSIAANGSATTLAMKVLGY